MMIKPEIIFTGRHYKNPERAPASERDATKTVNEWVKRAAPHMVNNQVPMVSIDGQSAPSDDEYQAFRNMISQASFPCPVALVLNGNCMMWVQDARGLPDTLQQAKSILECVNLTRRGRLPL